MAQSPPNGIKCIAMDCSSNLTGTQPATSLVEHDGILQATHWTDYPPPQSLYTVVRAEPILRLRGHDAGREIDSLLQNR